MRRPGFTILEVLVVLAIIGVLAGLSAAGVQKARAAARRAECSNRIRQLALATHHYHTVKAILPPGCRVAKDPFPCMTWGARLLPYLDQPSAWREAEEDYKKQMLFNAPVPHWNLARQLPVFLCPSSDRTIGKIEEGDVAAFSHYLGVSGDRGTIHDGIFYLNSSVTLSSVKDGTSHTVMIGERPPSADNHFGWWYAGVGMANNDGSADGTLAAREINRTFRAPMCKVSGYEFGPGDEDDLCSTFQFYSNHPGGAHFAFADGSVRFLSFSAKSVLPALATRAKGDSVAAFD